LGPMVYGVGHASRYYFGKPAALMTPRECAFLAAMLPGPRVAYNPYRNMAKVLRRSDLILRLLKAKGVLSNEEFTAAVATAPNINGLQRKVEESINRDELFTNQSSSKLPPDQPDKPDKPEADGSAQSEPIPEPAGDKGDLPAGKPANGVEK